MDQGSKHTASHFLRRALRTKKDSHCRDVQFFSAIGRRKAIETMSNLADVASAAAARQQLTDRHTLGAPLSPGSPKDKVAPNRELLGSARSSDPSATDHAENDDDTQHAVFEVHGKTVKVRTRPQVAENISTVAFEFSRY